MFASFLYLARREKNLSSLIRSLISCVFTSDCVEFISSLGSLNFTTYHWEISESDAIFFDFATFSIFFILNSLLRLFKESTPTLTESSLILEAELFLILIRTSSEANLTVSGFSTFRLVLFAKLGTFIMLE